jgi:hypothetical protein
MAIDWKAIAKQVGDLNSDGSEKGSGTVSGIRALELIVGEENIRGAVDQWTSLEPGAETAEKTLLIMRSTTAMEYCYEIYKNEPNTQRAGLAIFLLSEMADWRFMRWARELVEDSNTRWNAVVALEQVLEGPLGDEGIDLAKKLLAQAETDADQRLRERAVEIHKRLASKPYLKHLGL